MMITYRLMERFEEECKKNPARARLVTKANVTQLLTDQATGAVVGVQYTKKGKPYTEHGAGVILATGGFGADFSNDSLLRKVEAAWRALPMWRDIPNIPPLTSFPTTNGAHTTGDGIKVMNATYTHTPLSLAMQSIEVFCFLGGFQRRGEQVGTCSHPHTHARAHTHTHTVKTKQNKTNKNCFCACRWPWLLVPAPQTFHTCRCTQLALLIQRIQNPRLASNAKHRAKGLHPHQQQANRQLHTRTHAHAHTHTRTHIHTLSLALCRSSGWQQRRCVEAAGCSLTQRATGSATNSGSATTSQAKCSSAMHCIARMLAIQQRAAKGSLVWRLFLFLFFVFFTCSWDSSLLLMLLSCFLCPVRLCLRPLPLQTPFHCFDRSKAPFRLVLNSKQAKEFEW